MRPAILLYVTLSCAAGCSDSESPTAPSDATGGAGDGRTVTITSAGTSPRMLTIAAGSRVLFINNDTQNHEMSSDPHPEHTDCTEINAVGFLRPGERRETENFITARTCGFHDHLNPLTQTLTGTITVTP